MYASKISAILALCATSAIASDVYATFEDANNNKISDTNFDVSNTGCFTQNGAEKIYFTAGITEPNQVFDGPYCLRAFTDGGCPGDDTARQEFMEVTVNQVYTLDDGVRDVGSYKFQAASC